ncbi:phosphoenolpyruvate synthase [Haladaptatus pallidirubidus]|uniref:Probable phosphoenolpyruvate synthase n=1 Tax=Haladaptatus pallidirubidus TaxID=1008152 RepID=A0AAV3UR91_9EURY|nr:phosphoenolpyruvate synthase [Haladaptatus pallidirubidus]
MTNRGKIRSSTPYVISLSDSEATTHDLVGGKGANLAQLVAAGVPVPEGFCVTTHVFRELIDDEQTRELIDEISELDLEDSAAVSDKGAALRHRIEELNISTEIREEIESALSKIGNGSEITYAVRSSATAEDLPDASFAGQQETSLNVQGVEDIVDSIRSCMASLFTDRAIAYRTKNQIPHDDVALAVVVQRMINPEVSGILFTADPMTGNRYTTTIEAGLGLGEAFVSGEATTDSIRVDTQTEEILDYEIGDQQIAIYPHPESGTETIELPLSKRTTRVLTDEQVRTLVAVGKEISNLFESPQDIEWCLEDGEVYVVQSRPITSLFPVPSPGPKDDQLHVYVSLGHAQAFAEAMPPLVRDIWMAYTQTTFEEFGFGSDTQWAAEAGGRVYMDVTKLLQIRALQDLLPKQLAATSEPMGAALEDIVHRRGNEFFTKRSATEKLAAIPGLATAAWTGTKTSRPLLIAMASGFLGAFIGTPAPPESEEAKWKAWGMNIATQVRAPDNLAERSHAIFNLLDEAIKFPSTGPLLAAITAGIWLEQRFPNNAEDVSAIERGFPHELVTRINLGLGDLADIARDNPAVADALQRDASLEELKSVEGGENFIAALDKYLDEFGHRATGEIDISRPRWSEDPSGLLATVRANLEYGEKEEHREHIRELESEASEAAKRLEELADHGVLGSVRKRLIRQLIRTYRGYIQTREYPKQGSAYMFASWRDTLCDVGEQFVSEGKLADPDDVWFLRKEELFAALEGGSIDVNVKDRRAEFERYASMDAPPVLTSEGEAPSGHIKRTDVPDGALVGTGVSGGIVEGVARVVRDPAEETFKKGEILIAPSSDPGWTPLFLNAAGMVVEVGGQMSHGALVAREYGLPAVVSVPEATRRIETGQRVRVNGTDGFVELLK